MPVTFIQPDRFRFNPLSVSGCALWLDAADSSSIIHSSGAVSQWSDKSSSGFHVTQNSGSMKPSTGTRTQNGLNVIDFDGGDNLIYAASTIAAVPVHVFIVFKMDDVSTTRKVFDGVSGPFLFDATPGQWDMQINGAGIWGSTNTNVHLFTLLYNGASSSYAMEGAAPTTINTGNGSMPTGITIGSRRTTVQFLDGFIAELIIYGANLSDANRVLVRDYLNAKWMVY